MIGPGAAESETKLVVPNACPFVNTCGKSHVQRICDVHLDVWAQQHTVRVVVPTRLGLHIFELVFLPLPSLKLAIRIFQPACDCANREVGMWLYGILAEAIESLQAVSWLGPSALDRH